MNRLHRKSILAAPVAVAALLVVALAGCGATPVPPAGPTDAEIAAKAAVVMKASFKARGQAQLDRLDQDETQRVCSALANQPPAKDVADRLQAQNAATQKWPADGKYLGDWKNGEKIAQEGRGKQFSDDPAGPVGGNCYACHQIDPAEVSYGTIGPSLLGFGRVRGYGVEIQRYAYGKLYNAQAYNACSNMPRFGHNGVLTEQQLKDVTALLMDPGSPVNR
jgi:sulfur-oxidizing protein SoxX